MAPTSSCSYSPLDRGQRTTAAIAEQSLHASNVCSSLVFTSSENSLHRHIPAVMLDVVPHICGVLQENEQDVPSDSVLLAWRVLLRHLCAAVPKYKGQARAWPMDECLQVAGTEVIYQRLASTFTGCLSLHAKAITPSALWSPDMRRDCLATCCTADDIAYVWMDQSRARQSASQNGTQACKNSSDCHPEVLWNESTIQ